MKGIFNPDNPVMIFLTKVANILIVNLLWAIVSLPVVTVGAATTALYDICFKIVAGDDPSVLKGFFKAMKGNFKQGTISWLMLLAALAFIAGDIHLVFRISFYESMLGKVTLGVLLTTAILLLSMFNYVFALQSYFDNTLKNTLKNAALLGSAYCGRTLIMLVFDTAAMILGLIYCPLLVPVVPIWFNARIIRKIFLKIAPAKTEIHMGM